MNTQMHSIHFKADQKLLAFIKERLKKLEQFNNQIVSAEVFLKLDKDRVKENKITEIKLHIPGKDMLAKKQCKSFEEATNVAVEALRRQIIKDKTR